jgi:hypothetical protein
MPGVFDAAICLGNSFGYLATAGLREFIAALGSAVRPGGGLVVDFNCAAESILTGPIGAPRVMRPATSPSMPSPSTTSRPAGCSARTPSAGARNA